jgi:hypothetical protein
MRPFTNAPSRQRFANAWSRRPANVVAPQSRRPAPLLADPPVREHEGSYFEQNRARLFDEHARLAQALRPEADE